MDQANHTSILGASTEISSKSYESNNRLLRSSVRSSVRMTSSMSAASASNNAIVSNNYECLASTSSLYESSDDSVDFDDFNKTLRILDEEFELDHRDTSLWSYRAKSVLNFTGHTILNLICLPVYWTLVQIFVFEKWILHRRKSIHHRQSRSHLSQVAPIRDSYQDRDRASTSASRYRGSEANSWTASPQNDYQKSDDESASVSSVHRESITGKLLAFITKSFKSDRIDTRADIRSMVHESNGNGNSSGLISKARATTPRGSAKASINGNGNYNAFHRATPVGFNYRQRYSDIVNRKVNACRTILHSCKDKTANMYRRYSSSRSRRNVDDDGPSWWWLLLLGLLITGGLLSWLSSDLGPGLILDHIWSSKHGVVDDPNEGLFYPPIIHPNPAKGASDIPLPPEPEPDIMTSHPSLPIVPPAVSIKPEPVLDIPLAQSDLEPELPAPPIVDPPVVPVPPVEVSITSQVVPPVAVNPEVACVKCPPTNNIDVGALKKELTDHFTALIKEQCVSNCDCATGRGDGGGSVNTIGSGDITPDELDRRIQIALKKYDADKTGLPDLALEPSGGSVVSTRCTKHSQNKNSVVSFFGIPIWSPPNNPRVVIQPGLVPGECWSFEGSIGYIVIKLAGPSYIEAFSLEHIPRSISPHGHIKSAPKNFKVVGLMDYNDDSTGHLFGEYEYKDTEDDEPLQYFKVQHQAKQAYPYIELKIDSNHGNIEFTCVYRFRVHGHF